jgi:hypothetical protein
MVFILYLFQSPDGCTVASADVEGSDHDTTNCCTHTKASFKSTALSILPDVIHMSKATYLKLASV